MVTHSFFVWKFNIQKGFLWKLITINKDPQIPKGSNERTQRKLDLRKRWTDLSAALLAVKVCTSVFEIRTHILKDFLINNIEIIFDQLKTKEGIRRPKIMEMKSMPTRSYTNKSRDKKKINARDTRFDKKTHNAAQPQHIKNFESKQRKIIKIV